MDLPPRHPKTSKEDRELLRPHCTFVLEMLKIRGYEIESVLQLPQPWRLVFTSTKLDSEVRNGGFHQFFWNSEGEINEATEEDLILIGATPFVNIFKRAAACAKEFKVIESKRSGKNTWQEFTAGYKTIPWKILDEAFYTTSPTLPHYLAGYIRGHPADFEHNK